MKRVTVFSPVFPPEKGASPSRMYHLCKLLSQHGYDVAVVSFMPNYPTGSIFKEYKGRFFLTEDYEGLQVKRIWAYPSNSSGAFARMLSMFVQSLVVSFFFLFTAPFSKGRFYIINTPPLLPAHAAAMILHLLGKKIVLNVSDIWPHTALELGAIKQGAFYNFLKKIEARLYKQSTAFVGQSSEILGHIHAAVKVEKPSFLYYNLQRQWAHHAHKPFADRGRRLVYAGLLGVAQGVFDICQTIDFAALGIELHIYGEGNEKDKIVDFISANPRRGIHYHGAVPAASVPQILRDFDATLIPLKTTIHGALPSKIFMAMANSIPILLNADGEAADIVHTHQTGWVNNAGDYAGLLDSLRQFASVDTGVLQAMSANGTTAMQRVFNRERQDKEFLAFLKRIF